MCRCLLGRMVPLVALVALAGGCSKARGDDFSRFHRQESLLAPGATPRHALRYRPTAGQDIVYQLVATRHTGLSPDKARMRLRVALTFPTEGQGTEFKLRLLTILRLDPEPPDGAPELGPTHVLLAGALGPRGALERLEESTELTSPVNLSLVAPLLFTPFPTAAVGKGGSWRVAQRLTWQRRQGADSLTQRTGFDHRTDVILDARYRLEQEQTVGDAAQVIIHGTAQTRLRSRSVALAHHSRHEGTAKVTLQATVDRATGLPETASASLVGTYRLWTNDHRQILHETLQVQLTRER